MMVETFSAPNDDVIATLYNADCRDVLPLLERVDAVVTDPPYGADTLHQFSKRGTIGSLSNDAASRSQRRRDKYGRSWQPHQYAKKDWDKTPVDLDLLRKCIDKGRWVIVFGGNFYQLPPSPCWLVWDKVTDGSDFADCELAWTNVPGAVRIKRYMQRGMLRENRGRYEYDRCHPTQKPLGVMEWCLERLPIGSGVILDPFMGSATTGVAALRMGFRFIGIEREPDYFETACRRIATAAGDYAARLDFGDSALGLESAAPLELALAESGA